MRVVSAAFWGPLPAERAPSVWTQGHSNDSDEGFDHEQSPRSPVAMLGNAPRPGTTCHRWASTTGPVWRGVSGHWSAWRPASWTMRQHGSARRSRGRPSPGWGIGGLTARRRPREYRRGRRSSPAGQTEDWMPSTPLPQPLRNLGPGSPRKGRHCGGGDTGAGPHGPSVRSVTTRSSLAERPPTWRRVELTRSRGHLILGKTPEEGARSGSSIHLSRGVPPGSV